VHAPKRRIEKLSACIRELSTSWIVGVPNVDPCWFGVANRGAVNYFIQDFLLGLHVSRGQIGTIFGQAPGSLFGSLCRSM
jgi:hypothetical protein